MERTLWRRLLAGACLAAAAANVLAADVKDEAIQRDRRQIEGTWQVAALEINGNQAAAEDVKKFTVVNGADGTWTLFSEGNQISKGTSVFDPTQQPKAINFTPTEGDATGSEFLGIYELAADTRKLCFAPVGQARPAEFKSAPGSEHILVTFERQKAR